MNRRLLLAGLALLSIVALALALESFVREVIVVPLLYVLWIARLLLESIPQLVIWGVFMLIALVISVRSLSRPRPDRQQLAQEPGRRGRVEGWVRLIEQAPGSGFARWRLASALTQLALETLAQQERQPLRQLRRQLDRGMPGVSPELRAYLRAGMASYTPPPRQRLRLRQPGGPLDLDPEQVVRLLEARLSRLPGDSTARRDSP